MRIDNLFKKFFGTKSREEQIREFVEQSPDWTRKMLRGAIRMENKDLSLVFDSKNGGTFEMTAEELQKIYPDGIPSDDAGEPEPSGKIQKVIKEFNRLTSKPCLAFSLAKRKTSIFDNKFGGEPYLPKDFAYPLDASQKPMLLLAQLNFEKLPPLEGFPKTGILQFYMTATPGAATHTDVDPDAPPPAEHNFRVVYHKDVSTRKTMLGEPPSTKRLKRVGFPLKQEFALNAKIKNCPMTPSDYRFADAFVSFFNKKNDKSGKGGKTLDAIEEEFRVDFYEEYGEIGGHRIGGYPTFGGEADPRDNERYKDHSVLLLQIDSDTTFAKEEIAWEYVPVASFFISPAALEKLDFSDVLFSREFI